MSKPGRERGQDRASRASGEVGRHVPKLEGPPGQDGLNELERDPEGEREGRAGKDEKFFTPSPSESPYPERAQRRVKSRVRELIRGFERFGTDLGNHDDGQRQNQQRPQNERRYRPGPTCRSAAWGMGPGNLHVTFYTFRSPRDLSSRVSPSTCRGSPG